MLLLVHPDFHHKAVRQELCGEHLRADAEIVDGNVLLSTVQIAYAGADDFFRREHDVEIGDGIAAFLYGMVKELRFDPAGAHGHAVDAAGLEFHVECARVAEHECFRCAVNVDVRDGLERGKRRSVSGYQGFLYQW